MAEHPDHVVIRGVQRFVMGEENLCQEEENE